MVDQHVDERRRLHGGGDPAADRAGRPVRRDRRRPRRPARGSATFLEKPKDPVGPAGQPRRGAGLDGQLRLRRRRAGRGGHPRRRRASGSKHDMGGDIVPAFVRRNAGRRLRLQGQRRARARPTATAATGATSGRCGSYYAAHMDLVSPLPVFNLYNFDWPIYTSYGPQPPAKLAQGARRAARRDARESLLSPGRRGHRRRRSAARCCRRPVCVDAGAEVVGLGADERRARRRGRGRAQRDPRQERRRPARRRRSASTPRPTARAGSWSRTG